MDPVAFAGFRHFAKAQNGQAKNEAEAHYRPCFFICHLQACQQRHCAYRLLRKDISPIMAQVVTSTCPGLNLQNQVERQSKRETEIKG